MLKGVITAIVLLVVVLAVYTLVAYTYPVDIGDRVVSVIIEPGESFPGVADRLIEQGVVRSRWLLKYPARLRGIDTRLTPGRYDFTGKNSCRSVLNKLERADFVNIRVTIPEGAPIWRVASILADRMEIDSALLLGLNTDSTIVDSLGVPCLEGYLYPETYFFPWGTVPQKMVDEMVAMFRAKTDTIWTDSVPNGLSRDEVVVLASIVQAEALFTDEMPMIASVYHNRLRRKMKLDADPTVIYGLGGLERPLYRKDLRKSTPYNTYMIKGLPPTPINSPSVEAIRAVLHPAESDYMFFVADGSGRHHFSRTNAEHNRIRQQIKREHEQHGS